jgi:hypothetical protein
MKLQEIVRRYDTDKGREHLAYLTVYDLLFPALQHVDGTILEIGVEKGGSLEMWSDYFPDEIIFGLDMSPIPPGIVEHKMIRHLRMDGYADSTLERLKSMAPYRLIVDDGSHALRDQRWFCAHYPSLLAPGGLAIVEDIQRFENTAVLVAAIPASLNSAVVDLRHAGGRYDNLLLLIWKKDCNFPENA